MSNQDKWLRMREFVTSLEQQFHENPDAIAPNLKKLAEEIQKYSADFRDYKESKMKLYPKVKIVAERLVKRGWFISGYFGQSELAALGKLVDASTDDLERIVANMYRSSVNEHMINLIKDYPQRSFAIKPAIDAHNRGEYAISIPLFFIQADGISFVESDKYMFTRTKIQLAASDRLNAMERTTYNIEVYGMLSSLIEIMWIQHKQQSPVADSQDVRISSDYKGLNRHTVIHGVALEEYATEENSLQAFSMLSHIGSLMHDLKKQESDYPWAHN